MTHLSVVKLFAIHLFLVVSLNSFSQIVTIYTKGQKIDTKVNATSTNSLFTPQGTFQVSEIDSIDTNDSYLREKFVKAKTNPPKESELNDGFEIENDAIVWRKVYDTKLSFEELISTLKESGNFKDIETSESKIIGQTIPITPDYKGAGYSRGFTPMMVLSSNYSAFCLIEFKENRFRVTLKNIRLITTISTAFGKSGDSDPIDIYALKNDKKRFKESFFKDASKIYNYSFNKLFEVKEQKKTDW
jgi:hypothetical protein